MKQIFIFLVVLLPFLAKSQTVIYGKYKYTDSLTFAKYKNSSTLDSVLSVDQNGRLRLAPASGLDTTSLSNRIDARVKYTDTSSMLIPYLRKLDTTGKWLAVGYLPYLVKYTDTAAFLSAYYNKTVIDSKLALKLNISDTAAMLSPYARTANLPSLAPYVKYTDTSTMLSPYYRTANATAALALKLNISDTATMLSSYYNKTTVDSKVNLKVNISDTLSMLSPYQRSFLAVKYTDTASMLSNYRTNINSLISDSVYQAAQILLRVRYTDTSTMLSPYARTLSLGGYVPYSGATNDLNIGTHNLYANNFFDGFTNIAASGTQIVLTTASTPSYTITGSGGQTIKLPDATTLPNGAIFYFNNNQTTGAITINNNSNTLIISIPSGGFAEVYLLDNSIAAGSWDRHFQAPSNVSWSTNTFDYAGSITSATWNGVAVAVNRGGTGASTSGGALTNLGAQPQLNGTGFVKASGTTISYDNSTYLTTSSASSTYLPLGGGTMTGNLILNADPTNSLGAVTKNYVDNAITGIFWKSAVKAATTSNITLLGAQTIDGVSIVANDRVLVKNQSTATQNGIYLASTTIWTRTTDADTGGEIYGSAVFVENGGSINGGTQWTNSNTSQPTIGVDNISFSQIAGAGVYTAGTYLSLTGNVFDVNSTYSSNWNNKINPSDTATMLTPYLRSVNYGLIKSSQTVSADSSLLSTKLWRQKGIDSVAALDAQKVKYTDTATMLSAYYNKTATDAKFNLKVNISDTASMLSPYLRSLNASATYLTQTTAASTYYLQTNPAGYITSSAISGKVNYTDTATMLSAYYNKTASDAKFNLKVNITDTASMLSGYKTYYPRAAISLTVTGSSGASSYSNSTGVLNVPTYTLSGLGGEPAITAGTTSQYWRGDKTWQTLDKTAVGLSNVTNNAQVTSVTGTSPIASSGGTTPAISITQANTTTSGYLSSTDWNTFNGKQNTLVAADATHDGYLTSANWVTFNAKQSAITLTTTGSSGAATFVTNTLNVPTYTLAGLGGQPQLNGTGFVKASGTTISYDNSTYATDASVVHLAGTETITGAKTFSLDVKSLGAYISSIGASNTIGLGSNYNWNNASVSANRQLALQMNGSNGLTLFYYDGASWGTGVMSFTNTGGATFGGNVSTPRFNNTFVNSVANSRNSFQSYNVNETTLTIGWIAADFGDNGTTSDRVVMGAGYNGHAILGAHDGGLTAWKKLYINPNGDNLTIGSFTDLGYGLGVGGTFGVASTATFSGAVNVGVATGNPTIHINGGASGSPTIKFSQNSVAKGYIYTTSGGLFKFNIDANDANGIAITSDNNLRVGLTTQYSDTRMVVRGSDATSSNYAFSVQNSTPNNLFYIRNDGLSVFGSEVDVTTYGSDGLVILGRSDNYAIQRFKSANGATTYSTIYTPASGILRIETNGAQAVEFGTSQEATFAGNIGISNSPNSWGSILKAIQLGNTGGFIAGRTDGYDQVHIGANAYYDGTNWVYKTTNSSQRYYQADGAHNFQTASSGTQGSPITWNNQLIIASTGLSTFIIPALSVNTYVSNINFTDNTNNTGHLGIIRNSTSGNGAFLGGDGILELYTNMGTSTVKSLSISTSGVASFVSDIYSAGGIVTRIGASNSIGAGSNINWSSGGTTGMVMQLNASSGLDFWRYNSGWSNTGSSIYASGEFKSTGFYNAGGALGSNASNAKNHFTQFVAGNSGITTGWIAAAFGDALGNRTVIGQYSGYAVIAGHNGDLSNWSDLTITPTGNLHVGNLADDGSGAKLQVAGDIHATGNLVVSGTTFGGVTTQAYGYGHIYKGYTGSYYDVMFLNSGLAVDELQVSGGLNMVTTTAGFTVPNMTTTQKNALTKRKGMIVYDTTVNLLQAWNGSTWNNLW